MYVLTYTHIHTYVYIHTQTHTHICVPIYMHTYTHTRSDFHVICLVQQIKALIDEFTCKPD